MGDSTAPGCLRKWRTVERARRRTSRRRCGCGRREADLSSRIAQPGLGGLFSLRIQRHAIGREFLAMDGEQNTAGHYHRSSRRADPRITLAFAAKLKIDTRILRRTIKEQPSVAFTGDLTCWTPTTFRHRAHAIDQATSPGIRHPAQSLRLAAAASEAARASTTAGPLRESSARLRAQTNHVPSMLLLICLRQCKDVIALRRGLIALSFCVRFARSSRRRYHPPPPHLLVE